LLKSQCQALALALALADEQLVVLAFSPERFREMKQNPGVNISHHDRMIYLKHSSEKQ